MSYKTVGILFLTFAPIYTIAELAVGEIPNIFVLLSMICGGIFGLTKR